MNPECIMDCNEIMTCPDCGCEEFVKIQTTEETVELDKNGNIACSLDEDLIETETRCKQCRILIN